jgi:nucleoside-diphosphate-sugar epimerase
MKNNSQKILIVGMGDLGAEVAQRLLAEEFQVIGVKRSALQDNLIKLILADVTMPISLQALSAVHAEILIYCVAASGQSDVEYKAAYVDGLRNVLATQQHNKSLKHIFFVSSTRVYGQEIQDLLDESVPAVPVDFGGERLLEAEQLLNELSCKATVLRLSGIYGPGRLRMLNLAKSPTAWPKQNRWSNRIHRDDAAAFMVFLTKRALAGEAIHDCYLVTDSCPVPQYTVLRWIAERLHCGQPEQLAISGGKRLNNQRMLETGFQLQYPDYKVGYQALLSGLDS